MEIHELRNALKLAAKMRQAQNKYFKTRDQKTLVEARMMESEFDKCLKVLGIKAEES